MTTTEIRRKNDCDIWLFGAFIYYKGSEKFGSCNGVNIC